MDVERLLQRIKAESISRQASLEALRCLCLSFVSNIPFENMAMHGGKDKIWNLQDIYERIVIDRGGGVCCDLNIMFAWLLRQLGFKVELLKGHVFENEAFRDTNDHMALMVTLENDARYLTDVGWGGSSFTLPLEMEFSVEQPQHNGIYRLEQRNGLIAVEKKRQEYLKIDDNINKEHSDLVTGYDSGGDQWNIQYGFTKSEFNFDDYLEDYERVRTQNEFFLDNSLAVIQNEKGRKILFNDVFCEKEYVNPETIKLVRFQKLCSLKEIYDILEVEFGIKLNFQLASKALENL